MGIVLWPTAFRVLRDKIIFWVCVLAAGFMKNELMSTSQRKLWNLFLGNLIVDWMMLKIFTSYSFNALAMSSGLVKVLFFSITEGR